MGNLIQLLPESIANQIAAGEVVQRPASVVKELLENAIDAGAKRIILRVEQAGKTLIQVEDDGQGMDPSDAQLCFERHATSKLRTADDLFNIKTKGFRGEAMASIASVAQVELTTRTPEQEIGTHLKVEASKQVLHEPIACNIGTTVTVKNLFYNIPARRNFLKSDGVEIRHIIDEFQRVSIPHTQIHFQLIHNGTELFHLVPSKGRIRLVSIFGSRLNEKLVPLSEETDLVKISGFIGKPTAARKTRGEQFFFVNHRFIRDNALNHAVKTAFSGLIPPDHFPSYFIFLECDPRFIDVNIHPTKTEIKFEDEKAVNLFLKSTIRKALGQFQVAPSLDFHTNPDLEVRSSTPTFNPVQEPSIKVNPNYNPFDQPIPSKVTSFSQQGKPGRVAQAEWEAIFENIPQAEDEMPEHLEQLEFKEEGIKPTGPTIFQWNAAYLVTSMKSGVVIIDQHRAHQRIWYERLLRGEQGLGQKLLFPQEVKLNHADMAVIQEVLPDLTELGIGIQNLSKTGFEVDSLPVGMKESKLKDLIDKILEDGKQASNSGTGLAKASLCKSLARSLAIPRGRLLQYEEMHEIMNELFSCQEPALSPYGKPNLITLEGDELLKRFDR